VNIPVGFGAEEDTSKVMEANKRKLGNKRGFE
jgi:hypothetical protein